jgi:AcrR family transcriptional regulator
MDEKKRHIVMAAGEAFTRYGFKKASMQDIADAAMMSRAALYLHFRNKDDLFRTLMDWHHGEALNAAETAFASDRPFLARMEAGLLDFTLVLFGPVRESLHGQELFDANMALAGDTTAATSLRLKALMQDAVTRAVSSDEISLSSTGLSAETLTDLLYVCLDGIKKAHGGLDRLEERLRALMRVVDVATRSSR